MHRTSRQNLKDLAIDSSILLFAAALIVLPMACFGVPAGNDLPQHYRFAGAIYEAITAGDVFPVWPDSNMGFGDVGLRFYPPLSYYVMAAYRVVSGDWFFASVLAFLTWFWLGSFGIYNWAREWFGRSASLASAITYLLLPYHVNQIYNAFMYAEFAAAGLLPFCFLAVTKTAKDANASNIAGLAVSYALLLLTHLPMAVIGSVALGIYGLFSLDRRKAAKTLAGYLGGAFVALAATSFYWLRLVSELSFVRHADNEFVSGVYGFSSNFVFSFEYLISAADNARAIWFCDLMLLVTLLWVVPCGYLFLRRTVPEERQTIIPAVCVLAAALFFATPLSTLVWQKVPLLAAVQFPWRWIAIVTVVAPIFVAAGFETVVNVAKTKERYITIIISGLILAGVTFSVCQIIRQASFIAPNEIRTIMSNLPDTKSYECWWTVWAKPEAFADSRRVDAGGRTILVSSWENEYRYFVIESGEPIEARVATFYYPNWKAEVNGAPVDISAADDGTIIIPAPGERAEIALYFEEPLRVRLAGWISIFVWLAILSTAVYSNVTDRLRERFD